MPAPTDGDDRVFSARAVAEHNTRASLPVNRPIGNTMFVALSDLDRQDSGVPKQVDSGLVKAVRAGLAELADPAKAPDMQRYMKSDMPFRGVQKPARTQLAARVFADHPLSDVDIWVATVLELWRGAAYREERYLALEPAPTSNCLPTVLRSTSTTQTSSRARESARRLRSRRYPTLGRPRRSPLGAFPAV
jgi:DNA alkylation repair enzyme